MAARLSSVRRTCTRS